MTVATKQGGFVMIVLLIIVVVLVFLAIAVSYQLANSTLSSASHVGSMQALFQAESGLEYEQRRWAQNLDWYRSTTDPNPTIATPQSLGTGTFVVYSNLPATLVKSGLPAGGTTLSAYTTERFPASGILQIQDDLTAGAEFVRYSGISATTFTGLARAQTVGTVITAVNTHVRSDTVYPVTILRTALLANCIALASVQVDANSKFLSAGTLNVEGEEVGYAGSSTTAGIMTLTGVTRCLDTVTPVTPAAHAIGQPVTPVLVGDSSASYQVESFAVGTTGNNIRYARKTIKR